MSLPDWAKIETELGPEEAIIIRTRGGNALGVVVFSDGRLEFDQIIEDRP